MVGYTVCDRVFKDKCIRPRIPSSFKNKESISKNILLKIPQNYSLFTKTKSAINKIKTTFLSTQKL